MGRRYLILIEPDEKLLQDRSDAISNSNASLAVQRVTSFGAAEALLTEISESNGELLAIIACEDGDENVREQFFARVRSASPGCSLLLLSSTPGIQTVADRTIPHDAPEREVVQQVRELTSYDRRRDSDVLVEIIGDEWAPRCHDVKDYLCRHRIAYRWIDIENDRRASRISDADLDASDLPLLVFQDGTRLANPSNDQIAEHLGFGTEAEGGYYDVIIVGGGPTGLAAAVYAASEGLRTIVVERHVPGGQAGTSALIENYLGFPEGVSGAELAKRAVAQAERFGTEMLITKEAVSLRQAGTMRVVTLNDGSEVAGRTVVIASGVRYKKLEAENSDRLTGAGIYYGAASAEASRYRGREVCLLGGGNSAAQAAMLLARHAKHVRMIMFEDELGATMSKYLVARIRSTPNIELIPSTTVVEVHGEEKLDAVTMENRHTKERRRVETEGLFVSIGAKPHTPWLDGIVALDGDGFVLTGRDLTEANGLSEWKLDRWPLLLETSISGVFAAGDVRHGSVKRIGSAVGEGAMAVQVVHQYLRD